MAKRESVEMEEQFCGLLIVWVLKNESTVLPTYDAQQMLKGQAEEEGEKALKTLNALQKYEKKKVLFPWQRVLWCFCWINLPEKEDFPCQGCQQSERQLQRPLPSTSFANILLDVCECSDITQCPEMSACIDDTE